MEWIVGIAALIGMGIAAWWAGKREGRKEVEHEYQVNSHNEYVATRKRIDDALRDARSTDTDEWLRKRGQRGRDL